MKSVSMMKTFVRRLHDQFSEKCPHLLDAVDVRTFLTLVNEYFNSEMRQVTDTPTVLDCAMTFVEAADETLKRIAWPGFVCFTKEKHHYVLPSGFPVNYTDLHPVPQEPTTPPSKEDVKLLNDWRNEFGRGVRQQSVRSSFTKDKAGTLPFYMYMSVNSDKDLDEQSEMAIQMNYSSHSVPQRKGILQVPAIFKLLRLIKEVAQEKKQVKYHSHHILEFTLFKAGLMISPC